VNPESRRKHDVWFWIPGLRLSARPGMTTWDDGIPSVLVFAPQFPDDGLGTYGVAETISS